VGVNPYSGRQSLADHGNYQIWPPKARANCLALSLTMPVVKSLKKHLQVEAA
jgi:hypothetical protein